MPAYIAILDDEPVQAEYMHTLINAWAARRAASIMCEIYHSAEALLFECRDSVKYDLFLLDVEMDGMGGIHLAEKLRDMGSAAQILFVTAHREYISKGYDVDALHYLIKPVNELVLGRVLDKAYERMGTSAPDVTLNATGGLIRLTRREILCFESFSHEIAAYTNTETVVVRHTMDELESLMGAQFFRCHRSYLVNMDHVRLVTRGALKLTGGRAVPLARGRYEQVNRRFIEAAAGDRA